MSRISKTFFVILVLGIFAAIIICQLSNDFLTTVPVNKQLLKRLNPTVYTEAWLKYSDLADQCETDNTITVSDKVPVYYEDELLFNTNDRFDLGEDAGIYKNFGIVPNCSGLLLASFPTKALRDRDDSTIYAIYDTETGYRLFLFFYKEADQSLNGDSWIRLEGFPVLIKNILKYRKFKSVKAGDSIDKVCKIDPVAEIYKKNYIEILNYEYISAKYNADHGMPLCSIHYLTDGLLKIEYEMLESGELIVSNIIYNKDRIVPDILGVDIDYTIIESDLPD